MGGNETDIGTPILFVANCRLTSIVEDDNFSPLLRWKTVDHIWHIFCCSKIDMRTKSLEEKAEIDLVNSVIVPLTIR